jgi:CDP-glucose 4,6-dehydratase
MGKRARPLDGVVMFQGRFRNARVLVTGHTGFKGSWLTRWLLDLGAQVTGLALPPETDPSLFLLLGNRAQIDHREVDIRDFDAVRQVVAATRPEFVFHLAAQPLVRLSYREPKATWDVNVGGTVNLLEAIRQTGGVRACVVVTSDKCYENLEQIWGYREGDAMGGHDPYSSSKGATELAVASWRRSFFTDPDGTRVATGRAGNVIGGGDWAADRIVVDLVKAIGQGQPLVLRNPSATRPWQHVLEPLSGYLHLAASLAGPGGEAHATGWNFGPREESVASVERLARSLVAAWGRGEVVINRDPGQPHEAGLLKLDCAKARTRLGWQALWDFQETVANTVAWYRGHHEGEPALAMTTRQIAAYGAAAVQAELPWTL